MKQLPQVFSQRDGRWASQKLGTSSVTIGGYGCYVTAMAMLARFFGHDTNPGLLDQYFTVNNDYQDGNLMYDNNLQKAYSDCVYVGSYSYSDVPADLGRLKNFMSDPNQIVILEVDFNPATELVDTHFVVCVDCDGSTVTIADPWTGEVCNIDRYGQPSKTIQKMVVYKGNAVLSKPQMTIDQDLYAMLVGKASKYDDFAGNGFGDVGSVKRQLDDKQQQVQSANNDRDRANAEKDKLASDLEECQKQLNECKSNPGTPNVPPPVSTPPTTVPDLPPTSDSPTPQPKPTFMDLLIEFLKSLFKK